MSYGGQQEVREVYGAEGSKIIVNLCRGGEQITALVQGGLDQRRDLGGSSEM